MFNVGQAISRNCQGITRRELLQVGGLSVLGISLANLLRSEETRPLTGLGSPARPRTEKSCIFIFLEGGPSQFETFDPKPSAPMDIRGPYGNCATNVPGTQICELLPMMADRMDRCALIRSLTGFTGGHTARPALTGSFNSLTTYGAVVTRLKGAIGDMPPYVHLGGKIFNTPGIGGGILGSACDPIEIRDPFGRQVNLQQFSLSADVTPQRFHQRRELLNAVDQARAKANTGAAIERMDTFHQRAANILTSPIVRNAFDLSQERETLRERYGASHFGQSLLMARRLVEAGTRFVQLKWYDWDGPWDIHGFNSTGIERMEEELMPRFDQGLSTLLDDLRDRGLLASTLVVVVGEMGRTPRINHWGGRDHWGNLLFALLAGGGIPGGTVVGSSDAHGAAPATFPVQPDEFAATIYRTLGIDTNLDPRIRPFIGSAAPVAALV
ncbi:MAG: DUF1501 domain-containing protein [Gemmataceae bacterium]|nr:DUF1501 domain-containing protein [Gemmataceae bacterium]